MEYKISIELDPETQDADFLAMPAVLSWLAASAESFIDYAKDTDPAFAVKAVTLWEEMGYFAAQPQNPHRSNVIIRSATPKERINFNTSEWELVMVVDFPNGYSNNVIYLRNNQEFLVEEG